jgi:hypothetical protein
LDIAIPKGSVVYVRYLDHVLYRNTPKHVKEPAERETLGWLIDKSDEVLCIGSDRTIDELPYSSGSGSGLVLLKSCIIEVRSPLQKASGWHLIFRNPNIINAESALQRAKRKIQPQC